ENLLYDSKTVNNFLSAYYIATDIGALTAGFLTLYFVRRGTSVHGSRVLVYLAGSVLTALTVLVPVLGSRVQQQAVVVAGDSIFRPVEGPGWILLGLFLVIGFGSLAQFPIYYSLSQEISVRKQGMVTGSLSFCTWMATGFMHMLVGRWLDLTKAW